MNAPTNAIDEQAIENDLGFLLGILAPRREERLRSLLTEYRRIKKEAETPWQEFYKNTKANFHHLLIENEDLKSQNDQLKGQVEKMKREAVIAAIHAQVMEDALRQLDPFLFKRIKGVKLVEAALSTPELKDAPKNEGEL